MKGTASIPECRPFHSGLFFCLSRFVYRAVPFPIKVTLNSLMPYRIQMQQAAVYLQDGNKILTVDDFSAGLVLLFSVFFREIKSWKIKYPKTGNSLPVAVTGQGRKE
ncbi:hypothetical protein Barb7_02817 [Bacteroidales bacterium Barb7]|nr:hypothetical protein Barb7_02817 [Bacteroidales bacterium Barb7]